MKSGYGFILLAILAVVLVVSCSSKPQEADDATI